MRWVALGLALLTVCVAPAQFTKSKVRLLSHVDLPAFPGNPASGSGCAGYVSASGREYAVIGLRNGNAVVEITNPKAPLVVQLVTGPSSVWHEVVVLGDYAYAGTEAGGGVQIIDLRFVDSGIVTLANTFTFSTSSRVHTLQAHAGSKTVYLNGTAGYANGGVTALDCTDPANPVIKGSWNGTYVHDCTVFIPTTGTYAGKEILFACVGGKGLRILDATDKANITEIAAKTYLQNGTYCHSGSVSPDGRYFYANDEFDENNGVFNKATTHIFDIQNLANPIYLGRYEGPATVIDHNSMVQDGHLMLAAYEGGLRVYNVRQNPPVETGFLDTFPERDGFDYRGAWGVYAGFPSGNVIISDINRGLFVADTSEASGLGAGIDTIPDVANPFVVARKIRREDGSAESLGGVTKNLSLTAEFESTQTGASTLNVRLRGRSSLTRGARVEVFARRTGAWSRIGTLDLGSTMQTYSIKGVSSKGILGSDGKFGLRIQVVKGAVDLDALQVHL